MRKKFLAHFDENSDDWIDGKVSAGTRRVLYATWLSESWKEFFAEGGQEKVRHVISMSPFEQRLLLFVSKHRIAHY